MSFKSVSVPTKVFEGQKPGTSGLRKPTKTFELEHYTENFIQATLTALGDKLAGSVIVVGGDGRYFGDVAVGKIIRIAAANGVSKLIVGQNGVLSTPAVSALIRKHGVTGGIVLTASHNPGGPDADFGIKFNTSNGGPAPDGVTENIYKITTQLKSYNIVPNLKVDISAIGQTCYEVDGKQFQVDVIDSVEVYLSLMKEIFDFPKLKALIKGSSGRPGFKVLLDSMHGVTGPYVKQIFLEELGAQSDNAVNTTPLPDFGGHHPDPNLTYAADLVQAMKQGDFDLGAAFDGDGDRNMVLGKKAFFVTPSDSLAVLAAHLECIPYFRKTGVKGYARSMPTGAAVDRVAKALNKELFEVPTGWKYFGNLMDAGRLSLCGEESFGTGSDHIREKDGIWAVLAWLSVIEHTGKSVEEILNTHWKQYGRNYFTRYDYENCESEACNQMMEELEKKVTGAGFKGVILSAGGQSFTVAGADNFEYTDPIDGSVAKKQGIRVLFTDGSRLVYRLSGTGSSGATVRLYVESYTPVTGSIDADAQVALKPLVQVALELSQLPQFTGRDAPTVIT
uniref:phosphoglucomutase (alpha-D-glucose-1,6-bisphosphate-dependent) n=1 Tax=Cacopsylla melanoneura TaxID=428564 RepID=A0A8D8PV19_9HEMI